MRRHLSYANVAATVALVFSMGGGALAASRYLINSTKQINPKVLKKLRGNRGATGARGPQGLTGIAGAAGSPGSNGAVAGYSAGPVGSFFHSGEETTLVSKTLPPGHYIALATVHMNVTAEKEENVTVSCFLFDEADHNMSDGDNAVWKGPLVHGTALEYSGIVTLPLSTPLNTTQSSTVSVACMFYGANGELKIPGAASTEARLQAIQTTSNG